MRNASCPFHDDICRSQNGNLYIDTGYIDTHKDLGINAPPDHRFQYRQTTHCAPLRTDGYRDIVNYGSPSNDFKSTRTGTVLGQSFEFTPIDSLRHDDADVTLFFLSANNIFYLGEINDPWYAAHDLLLNDTTLGGPIYWADEPASPLGCVLRYQICDPSKPRGSDCTALRGQTEIELDVAEEFKARGMSNKRLNMLMWYIATVFQPSSLFQSEPMFLGSSSLKSNYMPGPGFLAELPDNQWQLDVEHWHEIEMTSMQMRAVRATVMEAWNRVPNNTEEKSLCQSQKIRSTQHSNFSVFGLIIIFTVGGVIIALQYTIKPRLACAKRRRDLDIHSRMEWGAKESLQLQRLAHESVGAGTWARCDEMVPVTSRSDRLATLDLEDVKHPRLKAAPPASDRVLADVAPSGQDGSVAADGGEVAGRVSRNAQAADGSPGRNQAMGNSDSGRGSSRGETIDGEHVADERAV
ncbi:hypothetical protein SLS58_006344 [Diplodia intermedia]|uniref:Uncharacterized protein n=1 Tax=Diplodia intermedia TaxID=856260 RepID=A0ABR3TN79_9PEZI